MMPRVGRRDAFENAIWHALIPGALLFGLMQTYVYLKAGMAGADSHAYWLAARDPSSWYTRPPASWDAYLYSPAFAQALRPLALLPWRAFQLLWLGAQVGVLWWLLAPLGWRRGLTLAPFIVSELIVGNVYVFFAAALVLALRRAPELLGLQLLTKVSPFVVSLWFAGRGQWASVFRCALVTLGIVAASVAVNPSAWLAWVRFLSASAGSGRGGYTVLRLALAVVVVLWASRRNQAWLLAPMMIVACPVLDGFGPLAGLAAIPRLLAWQRSVKSNPTTQQLPPSAARHVAATAESALPVGLR